MVRENVSNHSPNKMKTYEEQNSEIKWQLKELKRKCDKYVKDSSPDFPYHSDLEYVYKRLVDLNKFIES